MARPPFPRSLREPFQPCSVWEHNSGPRFTGPIRGALDLAQTRDRDKRDLLGPAERPYKREQDKYGHNDHAYVFALSQFILVPFPHLSLLISLSVPACLLKTTPLTHARILTENYLDGLVVPVEDILFDERIENEATSREHGRIGVGYKAMSVNGHYLRKRFRLTAMPYIRAYGESVVCEMLPRFEDMERRANHVANAEFDSLGAEQAGENCDGDMGWAADEAQDKVLALYETMQALRQTTLNLFAAGLFHLLEQQLADLCHDDPLLCRSENQPPNDTRIELVAQLVLSSFFPRLAFSDDMAK